MKKIIGSIFILQLIVFTIIGAALFFQNRYINMFYKNISYIDVLVSNEHAFDTFLSWTEERDITVSRISISSDNEVTIHMSDWALDNNLVLLEGRPPKQGEYVSDVITDDPCQSGILEHILPYYNFKIYGLYQAEQINFSSLYAINLTSEQEIMDMKNELASQGVTIELNEIWDSNSTPILLSSFSAIQVVLVLLFFSSSTLVMFVSLLQFVSQQLKSMNILISLGYGRLKIIFTVIGDLLSGKMWIGIVGFPFIILNFLILIKDVYRTFYIPIVGIYLTIMVVLICTYLLMLCGFILVYLITRRCKISLSIKGLKPSIVVQIVNYCVKFASVFLFIMAVTFLIALSEQFMIEEQNLQAWINAKDIYKVSMNDVGQEFGLDIEVELHKKVATLYQQLTSENNAFFMDADDIYAMEIYGENYPLTGLITNGYYTHITVSPNYFKFNPIVTSENISVEEELIYSDNVLNLLVPESLSSTYDELNEQFLDYFDFYRFRVYEEIYSDASNDLWSPSTQDELEINIIPVKTGQWYFTFSPNIRQDTGNRILDPVVVVYTNNFHPSSTFTKTSRCLYFQYDSSQEVTPNDYLAEIVEMNGFVFASSVWEDVAGRVSQLQRNYIAAIFLTLFIVLGYLVTSFSLFFNYFMRNQYIVTIKSLWGFSAYRRYASAFMMLFAPTLLALFVFAWIRTSRLARFFPAISIQGIILVGILLVGMDILYFVFMEKILSKKSINNILKGEVS